MHIYLAATCCMVDKSFAGFLNLTYGIFLPPPPGASRLPPPPGASSLPPPSSDPASPVRARSHFSLSPLAPEPCVHAKGVLAPPPPLQDRTCFVLVCMCVELGETFPHSLSYIKGTWGKDWGGKRGGGNEEQGWGIKKDEEDRERGKNYLDESVFMVVECQGYRLGICENWM
jgi:hypothetical protein